MASENGTVLLLYRNGGRTWELSVIEGDGTPTETAAALLGCLAREDLPAVEAAIWRAVAGDRLELLHVAHQRIDELEKERKAKEFGPFAEAIENA